MEETTISQSRLERFLLDLERKFEQESLEELYCPYCGSKALLIEEDIGLLCCQRCLQELDCSDFSVSKLSWLKALLEKLQAAFLHQRLDLEALLLQARVLEYELQALLEAETKEAQINQILMLLAETSTLLSFLYEYQGQKEQALEQAKRVLLIREQLIDLGASLGALLSLAMAHFDLGLLYELQGREYFKLAASGIENGMSLLALALKQARTEKDEKAISLIEQRTIYQYKQAASFYLAHQDYDSACNLIKKALKQAESGLDSSKSKRKGKDKVKNRKSKKSRKRQERKRSGNRSETDQKLKEKAELLSLAQEIYFHQGEMEKSLQAAQSALSLQKSLLEESLQELQRAQYQYQVQDQYSSSEADTALLQDEPNSLDSYESAGGIREQSDASSVLNTYSPFEDTMA